MDICLRSHLEGQPTVPPTGGWPPPKPERRTEQSDAAALERHRKMLVARGLRKAGELPSGYVGTSRVPEI
jgi:hypothetical protein